MMKRYLSVGSLLAVFIAVSGMASCNEGKITPAESELLGCDAYTSTLDQVSSAREQGKLSQGTIDVVDHVRDTVNPLCLGPAPDVDVTVRDIAVDAGVRTLQSVLSQL